MTRPNELDAVLWTYDEFYLALVASDKSNGEWQAVLRAAYRWRKDLLRRLVDEWRGNVSGLPACKVRFGRSIGIRLHKRGSDHWVIKGWRDHV